MLPVFAPEKMAALSSRTKNRISGGTLAVVIMLTWTAPVADAKPPKATFIDDFNGPAGGGVNESRWKYEPGDNVYNHERQWYTSGTKNAALDGHGNLVITAKKGNPAGHRCWYGLCEYTSARLTTAGKFTQAYGRFEARMKLPRGQGLWPAFWLLGDNLGSAGWPSCGEIDVMENFGAEKGTVHGSFHGPGYSGEQCITSAYSLPKRRSFSDDFHTFAVDWLPGRISFSVDGIVYGNRTTADANGKRWVFDHPFYVILNVAVGGGSSGDPKGTTFPQQLVVDYVHVYASD